MKSLRQIVEGILDADYGSDDTPLVDNALSDFFKEAEDFTYTYKNDSIIFNMGSGTHVIQLWSFDVLSKVGIKNVEFTGCKGRTLWCSAEGLSNINLVHQGPVEFHVSDKYEFINSSIQCKHLIVGGQYKDNNRIKMDRCSIECNILQINGPRELSISNNCKMNVQQLFLPNANASFNDIYGKLGVHVLDSAGDFKWDHYIAGYPDPQEKAEAKNIDIWSALGLRKNSWRELNKIIVTSKKEGMIGIALTNNDAEVISRCGSYHTEYKDRWMLGIILNTAAEIRYSFINAQ